jgi:hypothetical protein
MQISLPKRYSDFVVTFDDDSGADQFKWYGLKPHRSRTLYARATINGRTTYAHHFVLGDPPEGMVVDHINGNGLDNRLENLRFVTHSENTRAAHDRLGSDYKKPNRRTRGGVRHVIKRLADGTPKVYFYDIDSRKRISDQEGWERIGRPLPPALEQVKNFHRPENANPVLSHKDQTHRM